MKIQGQRVDGVLLVNVGGGQAVLLHGDRLECSRPFDEVADSERYGPWSPAENSLTARVAVERRLQRSRVVTHLYHLDDRMYNDKRQLATAALQRRYPTGNGPMTIGSGCYIQDMSDSRIVYEHGGRMWALDYAMDGDSLTLADEPQEVVASTDWKTLPKPAPAAEPTASEGADAP
jgi:hypothetical protein